MRSAVHHYSSASNILYRTLGVSESKSSLLWQYVESPKQEGRLLVLLNYRVYAFSESCSSKQPSICFSLYFYQLAGTDTYPAAWWIFGVNGPLLAIWPLHTPHLNSPIIFCSSETVRGVLSACVCVCETKKSSTFYRKEPSVQMYELYTLVLKGIMVLKRSHVVRYGSVCVREKASKWEHVADSIKRHGKTFTDRSLSLRRCLS